MKRKTRLSILLILFAAIHLVWADTHAIDVNRFLQFENEQLVFSMKFKGLNTAKSQMSLQSKDGFIKILWTVHTRSIFNFLFHIDNRYESSIDRQSGILLETMKKIDQKNIQQNFHIRYDWKNLQARTDDGLHWQVGKNCIDLLTMIYQIRAADLDKVMNLDFLLDVESQLWQVKGMVKSRGKIEGPFSHLSARQIVLTFQPFGQVKKRLWKT
ncbi:MAG: DUF3108 domain-containing protein, partial [Actinobacteria bacterium]|nr:DUF3108 domain-containing protein [Actinomycetota bacterium]